MIYEPYTAELVERGAIMTDLREAHRWQYFIWDNFREYAIRVAKTQEEAKLQGWHAAAVRAYGRVHRHRMALLAHVQPYCQHRYIPNDRGHYICEYCDRFSPLMTAGGQYQEDHRRAE